MSKSTTSFYIKKMHYTICN